MVRNDLLETLLAVRPGNVVYCVIILAIGIQCTLQVEAMAGADIRDMVEMLAQIRKKLAMAADGPKPNDSALTSSLTGLLWVIRVLAVKQSSQRA